MPTLEEQKQFASDLMLMKERAARLGLFYTLQRLEPATRMVGFEIAGTPEVCFKHEEATRP